MQNPRGPKQVASRARTRLEAVLNELSSVDDNVTSDEWLLMRARIGRLMASFSDELTVVDEAFGMSSAQDRILRYLQIRRGEIVTKNEISGVAGISAWARRVRELREDHGWVIHTSNTLPRLSTGQYLLVDDDRDPGLARAWRVAKEKAKLTTLGGRLPAKTRVLEFLKATHPRPADPELLAHVAGSAAEAIRSIEQLQAEGWAIERLSASDDASSLVRLVSTSKPASVS